MKELHIDKDALKARRHDRLKKDVHIPGPEKNWVCNIRCFQNILPGQTVQEVTESKDFKIGEIPFTSKSGQFNKAITCPVCGKSNIRLSYAEKCVWSDDRSKAFGIGILCLFAGSGLLYISNILCREGVIFWVIAGAFSALALVAAIMLICMFVSSFFKQEAGLSHASNKTLVINDHFIDSVTPDKKEKDVL